MIFATPARAATLAVAMFVGVLASVSLAPRAARAASAGIDDEKEARRLFQQAELEFNVGKFPEALADYQSAYEAKPLPGFLFNIAQCYRNMGNFERARFFFRRYLALEPRAPNRHRVDELIAEMSRQLEAKQAEAAAARPAPPTPEAAKPDDAKPDDAKRVEAKPGDAKSDVITPLDTAPPPTPAPVFAGTPAPASDLTAPAAALVSAPSSASPARRPVWKRWWFWSGVAVVVAGGVVATYVLTRPETQTPGSLAPIDDR